MFKRTYKYTCNAHLYDEISNRPVTVTGYLIVRSWLPYPEKLVPKVEKSLAKKLKLLVAKQGVIGFYITLLKAELVKPTSLGDTT